MKLPKLFRRKPQPITVFISGAHHSLLPGEAIEARAQDGSKLVVTRSSEFGDANALEIIAYESLRKPVRGVMPRAR